MLEVFHLLIWTMLQARVLLPLGMAIWLGLGIPQTFRLYMKIMGPVHLPKQPPSVDSGYLYNNHVTECNVPCNETSHINSLLVDLGLFY